MIHCLRVAAVLAGLLLVTNANGQSASKAASRKQWDRWRDYQARLAGKYDAKLNEWKEGFLKRRDSDLGPTAMELRAAAITIRKKEQLDWAAVGAHPAFRKVALEHLDHLRRPQRIRSELQEWAVGVEALTRDELLLYFRDRVAIDLGKVFNDELAGKVQEAVKRIPLEDLLNERNTQEKMLAEIERGLPKERLTATQIKRLDLAASVLVRASDLFVAKRLLTKVVLAVVVPAVVEQIVDAAKSWVQAKLAGEPDPETLRLGLRTALERWNEELLVPRMKSILDDYIDQQLRRIDLEVDRLDRG